ncbi:MAG: CBS domain-containing protein [Steroidobacteraceae bacterium]|jgi:CBS domain-containing protein
MRRFLCNSVAASGFALLSPAAFAAVEDVQTTIGKLTIYVFFLIVAVVIVAVYFMSIRDRRRTPLSRLFDKRDPIHSVGPDVSVTECVRTMTSEKLGALIIMDGQRLIGIFTERDAMNKVLAAGRDPLKTKVSEVMTDNPYSIPPTTTVGEAMTIVTNRRFRHLPIVENGKVLAVISSGDLTHWMMQDKTGSVQQLVDIADRT